MNSTPLKPVAPEDRPALEWFAELPIALQRACEAYNLPETDDFSELAELSAITKFEGIEAFGDAAVKYDNGQLVAPASVYVTLTYDPNSNDPVELSDSFPADVYFTVQEKSKIEVTQILVDTSSFHR